MSSHEFNADKLKKKPLKERDSIQQKMLHWVETEVEKRLQQSLHNRVYIVLDQENDSEQVQHPWEIDIKLGEQPSYPLSKDTPIEQVFNRADIAGRLLILGAPGSGKTTMLLKLAEQLVIRAKDNSDYPIPVLFNLSSWKAETQTIKDWMISDLKAKYGVRQDIAKIWIEEEKIIPLLDGLDELEAERQEKCVQAINEFLKPAIWSRELVICSRLEEYQYYSKKIRLNSSIILKPLTTEKIKEYVLKTEGDNLWNHINTDLDLMGLAKNPLFLNIIILSYQEISFERWNQFKSSEHRQSYLFDAYIQRMLKRSYKGKQKPYKDKETLFWLGWLAKQLIQEYNTEFLIEKMQLIWLENQYKKITDGVIIGIIVGLIYGVIVGLIYGVIGDFVFGLIHGVIAGLIYGVIAELIYGLTFGLIGGLITGLIRGLKSPIIEYKNTQYQGIKQVIKNTIVQTRLVFLPCCGLLYLLSITEGLANIFDILVLGFGFTLLFNSVCGGSIIFRIKHFSLRLVLWFNRYIPWNYARFLNYSTNRLFLQRVGGGYRFVHDLLRQHFAEKY
ncbi:MAG: NACHT domain-containing protein [Microcoleaceae cyanobacterium]